MYKESVNSIQILTLTDFEQIVSALILTKSITSNVYLTFNTIRNNTFASGLQQHYMDQCRDREQVKASLNAAFKTFPTTHSVYQCTRNVSKHSQIGQDDLPLNMSRILVQ